MSPLRPSCALVLVLTVGLAAACSSGGPEPPPTDSRPVTDTLFGETFTDPYRWLEEQDHPDVRQWIDRQNAFADAMLARAPLDAGRLQRLRGFMDAPDIGRGQRGGGFEYFMLRRTGEELASLYRRPAPEDTRERIDPAGSYELVLDARPLSSDLSVSIDLLAVTSEGARLVYTVRNGGQDERELRVLDVKTKQDIESFPNALYDSVSLRKDGTGFYYVRRSRETGARVRSHDWGAPIEEDVVIFGESYGPTVFVSMAQSEDGGRFLFTVRHGWARSEVWLQDVEAGTAPQPVVRDVDAHFVPRFEDLELWMRTDLDAPMGRIVAVDLTAPTDRARWTTVLPEQGEALEDFTVIDGRIYASYLRDASSRIRVFEPGGEAVGEVELPAMVGASIDGDGDRRARLTIESFTMPETVYVMDLESGERRVEDEPQVAWNSSGVATALIFGTSKDGTRVPVFVVGRTDRPSDGSNRVLLGGYGGFSAAQKPRFSPMAASWIDTGGVYAYAVLRGGSEYGEAWHRAGMLTNKQHVFDDFIAAAEALIANGTTTPDRLAIVGTSNGGLLVGAALTQRPDLYRAVLCGFPDVDVLRFNQFTTNNNMPALLEYGDAAVKEQFDAIKQFSPYQNVHEGTEYPAVMVWTGDLDTRVPPLAGRKFAAALQNATASGHPVILRYNPRAGHASGNGMPFSGRVNLLAEQLAFLDAELGPR